MRQRLCGHYQGSLYHTRCLPCPTRYYLNRNQSSLAAFAVGKQYQPCGGMILLGAHTDSPCFKFKPVSSSSRAGFLMCNVETYGGGLWTTWFDRDLSVAGRVLVRQSDGAIAHKLVSAVAPVLGGDILHWRGHSRGWTVNCGQSCLGK